MLYFRWQHKSARGWCRALPDNTRGKWKQPQGMFLQACVCSSGPVYKSTATFRFIKGLGTFKGHAEPSSRGGEEPAVMSRLTAARFQRLVCQTRVHKVACGCSEGCTTPCEEESEQDGVCRWVRRQRGAREGATRDKKSQKSLGKVFSSQTH